MIEQKKLPLIKRLSLPGWQGWILMIAALAIVAGAVSTLPDTVAKHKLKNYYHHALEVYADTSGNARIEPDEEKKFIDDFNADIRELPGYEDFRLKADDIPKSSIDARTILPLLQKYRPVPTF